MLMIQFKTAPNLSAAADQWWETKTRRMYNSQLGGDDANRVVQTKVRNIIVIAHDT
jgi:hypothetical protein